MKWRGLWISGFLLALGSPLCPAQASDAGASTYNRVPLSDSATSTTESVGDSEPAPAFSAPLANWLEDRGVNFRGSLIDQWARNPSGGVAEGSTNVGQFNAGLDLNLRKLVG